MSKIIELTQGYQAIVADEDFEFLNQFKWYVNKTKKPGRAPKNYAARAGKTVNGKRAPKIYMHRFLMEHLIGFDFKLQSDDRVDHDDGNSLHNCRHNINITTEEINSAPFYELNRQRQEAKQQRQQEECDNVPF